MSSSTDFDLFDFLGIEVTDNLAAVQKALNDLPARKMATLRKNPEFSKMRSFLFAKTATPAYREYVQNIRNLRLKNKPQTNANQKPRQYQTDTRQPHSNDVNALSDPDKQQEWIRRYDERVNELNNRNRNNDTKSDSNQQRTLEQHSNERNGLQRLADLLNQAPDRKASRIFTIAWFLSTKSICEMALICFMIAILTSFFDSGFGVGLLFKFVFLLALGYAVYRLALPDVSSLNLIKNGYFTLGRKGSNGDVLYTDNNNTQHRWRPKSYFFSNDNFFDECLIVTDRNNPNQIKVLSVSDYQTSSGEIKFVIPEWFLFLNLPVTFDLSKSEFSTASRFLWYLLASIIFLFIVCQ